MRTALLLFSLAVHAHHARSSLYHASLLLLLALGGSPGPVPGLLCRSSKYFIIMTALGDVQRAAGAGETWRLYLPGLAAVLYLLGPRYAALASLAGAAGLHCLLWERES